MGIKCTHMNFSATFDSITGVTQKFVDNSQIILVNESFNPTILPVPEMIQEDVPRVIAISNGKHSQIALSKINCSITTNFDENFSNDIKKCTEYFNGRINVISKMLNSIETDTSLNLKFLGVTTELILDKEDAVNSLKDYVIKVQMNDICDIDLQITRIIEERYYVNVRISNTRMFMQNFNPLTCGFLEKEYTNGIKVTIDINNRYAFSMGKDDCKLTELEMLKKLSEKTISDLPSIFGKEVFCE